MKIVDIGPECFADGDELVISYKGENYYKACGKVVDTPRHSGVETTTCTKRANHPSKQCEDYYGNTREFVAGDSEKPALTALSGG